MAKRKRKKSLTRYVVFSLAVLLVYTICNMITFFMTGNEPSTLTTCVFSVFGGEILSCALIKIFKLKEEKKEEPLG